MNIAQTIQEIFLQKISDEAIADFLLQLKDEPITSDNLFAAANAMLTVAVKVDVQLPVILDTCGTGGDGAGLFNISTAVALIVASMGIPVAKHGNRAISSQSGSADLLEALGVPINLSADQVAKNILSKKFAFMFAPNFHPATAQVQKIRRQLKVRTLFNLLGPLTNPAKPTHQLVGIYDQNLLMPVAETLKKLGRKKAWVVASDDGLDEISLAAPTRVVELDQGIIREFTITPESLGFTPVALSQLQGASALDNAKILTAIFSGNVSHGAITDAIVLNAAAALVVAESASDLSAAINQVRLKLQSATLLPYLESLKVPS